MIRTPYYRIERNGEYVELHLTNALGQTLAIGDFTLTEWSQMERFRPEPTQSMSMAADHAVVMGTSRW